MDGRPSGADRGRTARHRHSQKTRGKPTWLSSCGYAQRAKLWRVQLRCGEFGCDYPCETQEESPGALLPRGDLPNGASECLKTTCCSRNTDDFPKTRFEMGSLLRKNHRCYPRRRLKPVVQPSAGQVRATIKSVFVSGAGREPAEAGKPFLRLSVLENARLTRDSALSCGTAGARIRAGFAAKTETRGPYPGRHRTRC